MAHLRTPRILVLGLRGHYQLTVCIREVETARNVEILVEAVLDVDRGVDTVRLDLAEVTVHVGAHTHRGRQVLTLHVDARTIFGEVLDLNVGEVQQVHLQTYVLLLRDLPLDIGVGVAVDRETVVGVGEGLAPAIARTAEGDIRQEEESVGGAGNLVVTHASPRILEFECGQHLTQRLPELLARDHVTDTDGGEETPTLRTVELLRAVVRKRRLHHVTAVVSVCNTSAHTLITRRQRCLYRGAAARVLVLLLRVDQHRSDIMLVVEVAVVVQADLVVGLAGGRTRRLGVTQSLRTLVYAGQSIGVVQLVVALQRVEVGIIRTLALIRTVGGYRRLAAEHKAAGHEIEILLQRELRDDRIRKAVLVTLDHLGVRVGHRTRRVDTEQYVLHARELLVRLIHHGELNGVTVHHVVEDGGGILDRSRIVLEHRVHVDLHARGARQVDVHLGHEVETVDVDVVLEVVGAVLLQDTRILVVGHRHVVTGDLTATVGIERIVLVVGHLLEHLVVPVDVGIDHGVDARDRILDLLCRIAGRDDRVVVVLRLVVHAHVGHTVDHLRQLRRHRDLRLVTERHRELALASLLGRHGDHTVRTLRTVEGGRRRILQNREVLDVVGLHVGQIVGRDLEAVEQDQRALGISERGDTADEELGIVAAGLTAALVRDKARDTPRQRCGEVARRHLQFLGIDRLDRGYDRLLLLCRESRYHDIFDHTCVDGQLDLQIGLAINGHLLSDVTDIRDLQNVGLLDREPSECSVGIGHDTRRGTLDHDGGTGQRHVVACIQHTYVDALLLLLDYFYLFNMLLTLFYSLSFSALRIGGGNYHDTPEQRKTTVVKNFSHRD